MDQGLKNRLVITAESRALLAEHAEGNLLAAEKLPDGRFVIWVDDDVQQLLAAINADTDAAIRTICTPSGVGHA